MKLPQRTKRSDLIQFEITKIQIMERESLKDQLYYPQSQHKTL